MLSAVLRKEQKMVKINSDKVFGIFVHVILILFTFIMLYPLYFMIIASFSEPSEVVQGNVMFWFKGFTLDSYKQIIQTEDIWIGYRNTFVYTFVGTFMAMCLTIPAAFAMSRKCLWKKNWISVFFLVPMYIGGGMLPTYLQIKNLGLLNQPYTQIVLGSFSIYNMIVARNYFQTSIPDSLFEAAEIDGASVFRQFGMIALPLAKPILAVLTLYYATGRWNDFMTSLLYVTKSNYFSLQFILRNILTEASNVLSGIDASTMDLEQYSYYLRRAYLAEAMKYSIIIIASLPMLIMYPFVQKYFVKGVMVGSLKG